MFHRFFYVKNFSNFGNQLGVPKLRAEITPFEPDAANTAAGKKIKLIPH